MEVKLNAYTPNPEITCAEAATVSYKKEKSTGLSLSEAREILDKVLGYGHVSILEHASFTFYVSGVSRSCTHQLVRHRIASYTQQSMRHVNLSKLDGEDFIIPDSIRNKHLTKSWFINYLEQALSCYRKLLNEGIPKEDARYILPLATPTNIAITMNARELLHFFALRCCLRSQWEIRELANKMLDLVKPIAPSIFKHAGPSCVKLGYCPEGELTCGEMDEVIKQYSTK